VRNEQVKSKTVRLLARVAAVALGLSVVGVAPAYAQAPYQPTSPVMAEQDRLRQDYDAAVRREADLAGQLAAQEQANARLREQVRTSGAAGMAADLASASAEAAELRRRVDDARARRDAARERLDKARAAAVVRYEADPQMTAALRGADLAARDAEAAAAPVLERLAQNPDYQELQALVDAAAQSGEALQLFVGTSAAAQAEADAAFDAALTRLRAMEDSAIEADPTAREARKSVKVAQETVAALRAEFDKRLDEQEGVVTARLEADTDQGIYDDVAGKLAAAERRLSALRQAAAAPGAGEDPDGLARAIKEGEDRVRQLSDELALARASKQELDERVRVADGGYAPAAGAYADATPIVPDEIGPVYGEPRYEPTPYYTPNLGAWDYGYGYGGYGYGTYYPSAVYVPSFYFGISSWCGPRHSWGWYDSYCGNGWYGWSRHHHHHHDRHHHHGHYAHRGHHGHYGHDRDNWRHRDRDGWRGHDDHRNFVRGDRNDRGDRFRDGDRTQFASSLERNRSAGVLTRGGVSGAGSARARDAQANLANARATSGADRGGRYGVGSSGSTYRGGLGSTAAGLGTAAASRVRDYESSARVSRYEQELRERRTATEASRRAVSSAASPAAERYRGGSTDGGRAATDVRTYTRPQPGESTGEWAQRQADAARRTSEAARAGSSSAASSASSRYSSSQGETRESRIEDARRAARVESDGREARSAAARVGSASAAGSSAAGSSRYSPAAGSSSAGSSRYSPPPVSSDGGRTVSGRTLAARAEAEASAARGAPSAGRSGSSSSPSGVGRIESFRPSSPSAASAGPRYSPPVAAPSSSRGSSSSSSSSSFVAPRGSPSGSSGGSSFRSSPPSPSGSSGGSSFRSSPAPSSSGGSSFRSSPSSSSGSFRSSPAPSSGGSSFRGSSSSSSGGSSVRSSGSSSSGSSARSSSSSGGGSRSSSSSSSSGGRGGGGGGGGRGR